MEQSTPSGRRRSFQWTQQTEGRGISIDYVEMNVSMATLGANILTTTNINREKQPIQGLKEAQLPKQVTGSEQHRKPRKR